MNPLIVSAALSLPASDVLRSCSTIWERSEGVREGARRMVARWGSDLNARRRASRARAVGSRVEVLAAAVYCLGFLVVS